MVKKTFRGRNKNRGVRSRKGNKSKHVSRKMSGKGRSNGTRRKTQRGGVVTVLGGIELSALALFLAVGPVILYNRYKETLSGEKVR